MSTDLHKSECPAATGHHATNQTIEASIVCADKAEHNPEKQLATIRAALALKGHAVHLMEDGSFLVMRWGLTRPCTDLAALRAFAEMLGVVL